MGYYHKTWGWEALIKKTTEITVLMTEQFKQDGTALVRAPELYSLPSHGNVTGCVQEEKINGQMGIKKHPGRGH